MTSTNKRDGGEVIQRWEPYLHRGELYAYDEGRYVLFSDHERALAESRESLHYANGVAELAMKHRDIAEAQAKRLAGLLREVSRNGWGKQSLKDGMHETPLLQRIDAALEQEPQE